MLDPCSNHVMLLKYKDLCNDKYLQEGYLFTFSFSYEMRKNIFLYGSKDPGDVNEQPYTTEHMKRIKGGFKELSKPFVVKSFDFNDPKVVKHVLL